MRQVAGVSRRGEVTFLVIAGKSSVAGRYSGGMFLGGRTMGPFSRMMTGLATRAVARAAGGVAAGPAGMAMGMALPYVVRALGPAGMVGMAVGGWVVKRTLKKRAVQNRVLQNRGSKTQV
jgi:hypothetical protein